MSTLLTGYRGLAESFLNQFQNQSLSVLVRNEEAVADLRRKYPSVFFFVGDLRSRESLLKWVDSSINRFGRIINLINNAVVSGPAGRLGEVDFSDFEEAIDVNLLAPTYLTQLCLQHWEKAGVEGVAIQLSGGGALTGRPLFSSYAMAKSGLHRLSESLAVEYPRHRFYTVHPGGLFTPLVAKVLELDPNVFGHEYVEAKRRSNEGGDDPKIAAELIAWLCATRPTQFQGKLIHAIKDNWRPKGT